MGGSGGGSSASQKIVVPKEAKPLAGKLLTTGEGVVPNASDLAFKPYEGQFQLNLTPQEEILRQRGLGQLAAPREGENSSRDLLLKTVHGDFLNPETNPYLKAQADALSNSFTRQLGKDTNSLRDTFGRTGGGGGSREALALGTAAGESSGSYANTIANLLAQNYMNERGYQNSSINPLLNVEDRPYQRTQEGMQLESIPRTIDQANLTGKISEFERQQSERYAPLNAAMAILGQRLGTKTNSVSSGSGFGGK